MLAAATESGLLEILKVALVPFLPPQKFGL
jgi:hypothetical protein